MAEAAAAAPAVVHRCRFIEYSPEAITAMVLRQTPANDGPVKVAVARRNGDVEIWSVAADWLMERVLPGGADSSVEALAWCGNTLFTAGLHSLITVWDVETMSITATADSYGGSVWCMALNNALDTLVAGCEDGCIKLFGVVDGGLEYVRSFDKQEGRVLSLDWHENDQTLVSGASDGTVRVWTAANGRCKFRIVVQDERKEGTLVWAVRMLPDGTIISGDSHGRTQFWDGEHGTLLHTFKQHEADVQCLAVSDDAEVVYASGVDSKVIQLQRVETERNTSWIVSGRSREHTHDVRAVLLIPRSGLLVTGGVDTSLIVYQHSRFGRPGASHRKLPPFPHHPVITLAGGLGGGQTSLLMYRGSRSLQLWRLGFADGSENIVSGAVAASAAPVGTGGSTAGALRPTTQPLLLLELEAKDGENIISSCISEDGSLLAYSCLSGTRVFRVAALDVDCTVSRLSRASSLLGSAHAMTFAVDSTLLVAATTDRHLQVLDLKTESVVANFDVSLPAGGAGKCLLAVSDDGQWSAVTYGGEVHVYSLDTLAYQSSTQLFDSQPTVIAFQPASSVLVVVCANNSIHLINVETGNPTAWTREHGSRLPAQWRRRKEKILGIAFEPGMPNIAYMHDHSAFCVINFDSAVPSPRARLVEVGTTLAEVGQEKKRQTVTNARRGKRKGRALPPMKKARISASEGGNADEDDDSIAVDNFKLVKRYQPLLFMGFSAKRTIVVVERPWLAVMQTLPPALHRKKYGA